MSNERFIRLGQRCGNSLGMPRQGQSLGTDRQSPYPVSSPEETQLVPEVTTGRVKKSEVTVRSPALLFSFSQRNKNVPMPEDGHKQNRLCKVRKTVMESARTLEWCSNVLLDLDFRMRLRVRVCYGSSMKMSGRWSRLKYLHSHTSRIGMKSPTDDDWLRVSTSLTFVIQGEISIFTAMTSATDIQ